MKLKNSCVHKLVAILLVLCMLSSGLVMTTASAASKTVDIVVLVKDVAMFQKIKAEDVAIKTVKNVNVPSNIISKTADVVGKYAKSDLFAGEYVYEAQLTDESGVPANKNVLKKNIGKSSERFVVVTDYIYPNTGIDVSTYLQELIDQNLTKTIYFPDGEYLISKPILTYGAAAKTVSLWLSDGAVIKAASNWRSANGLNSLICLGAKDAGEDEANDVISIGSYYSLQGGTLDGSGKANGLSIDGGRESLIKNIIIKDIRSTGIEIKKGANGGSSDMDIDDVTIIGNGKPNSKGIDINQGYDNTFSNIRIYNFQIGIEVESGGNSFHNISVIHDMGFVESVYAASKGLSEVAQGNFYYHCYVENYATAFEWNGIMDTIDVCTARWTKAPINGVQTAFKLREHLQSPMSAMRAEFFDDGDISNNTLIQANSGHRCVEKPIFNANLCNSQHSAYIR